MNATSVEQLLVECHPDWTGFSAGLVKAAIRSSQGRRTLLNQLAPKFKAMQRLDRTSAPQALSEEFATVANTCWLPADILLSRLTTLGSCFYLKQICLEIRRPQVARWKAILGADQYRFVVQDVRSCLSGNLSLPRSELYSLDALLALEAAQAQEVISGYGLFTMLAVGRALAPNHAAFEDLSMRLGSLFPPHRLAQWLESGSAADATLCEQTLCLLALWPLKAGAGAQA